jgi:hypothetical protein
MKTHNKKYKDCSLDELEEQVTNLENMSIAALKSKKKTLRYSILKSVLQIKKIIEKRLKK